MELKIAKNIESLIWPLSEEEHEGLKQQLLHDGCCKPFCVWHDTLLDGMHSYQICQAHAIPFQIRELHLKNLEEAIIWVCKDQQRRLDLPSEMRKYLIGKRYAAEKILAARNFVRRNQYSPRPEEEKMRNRTVSAQNRTATPLAQEYQLCCTSIQKYGTFALAIDRIANVEPSMLTRLLCGQILASQENIIVLAGMSDLQIKLIIAFLNESGKTHLLAEDFTKIVGYTGNSKKRPGLGYTQASVKDMPTYDPDTEVLGLALTIPSWCSSVRRVQNTADMNAISPSTRDKLCAALRVLQDEIAAVKQAIQEDITR